MLLTLGRRSVAAFAADTAHLFVVRCVDPPQPPLPPRHELLLARGPFTEDGERDLLVGHAVRLLVTRDSGGDATAPKLSAARALGVPVVLVDRPPPPTAGVTLTTVADAASWAARPAHPARPGDTGR